MRRPPSPLAWRFPALGAALSAASFSYKIAELNPELHRYIGRLAYPRHGDDPMVQGEQSGSWLDVPASAGPHTFFHVRASPWHLGADARSSTDQQSVRARPCKHRNPLHTHAFNAGSRSPPAPSLARLFRSRNQTKWVAVPALQLRPTATAMCPCMTSRPALRRLRLPRTPASASPPTLACTAPASSRAPRRPSTSPSRSSRRTRLRPVTGRRTRTRRTRWPPPCSSGPRTTVSTPPARARTRNRAALVVGYNFG